MISLQCFIHSFLVVSTSQDDDNLAFRLMRFKMGQYLIQRTTDTLLMHLRYLTAHTHPSVRTISLNKLFQHLHQSIRRLIENHGTRLALERQYLRLAAFFLRQKAFEGKSVTRQAAAHQCWHKGCRSRQTLHLNASPDSLTHQEESRIADARCTGIADERNVLTSQQTFHDPL